MATEIRDIPVVDVASVSDLVNRRLSDDDRWNLALVQRDEVWSELRMRHLVDSLLAGYPVGAILLSQLRPGVERVTRELVTEIDGTRSERTARDGSWQVLDGQQRINALFSVFTKHGRYGTFYLDMTTERPAPSPSQGRSAKTRSLPHLKHAGVDCELRDGRERCIDLSRWHGWASQQPDLMTLRVSAENVRGILLDIDPLFAAELSDNATAEQAAETLERLVRAWTTATVPIIPVQLDSALDVLEVFTRINLGGVQVAGDDVYFAGVKTHWRDAEARMDTVLEAAPILNSRIAALRLMSRLASRGIGHGDMLPLTVERLSGPRGSLIRAALEELTQPQSVALRRIRGFTSWYLEHSLLGHVLKQVTPELWEEVLAWAAASQREDVEWFDRNRQRVDTYLLGATLFGYRSVMGDIFRRLAFGESLEAGARGESFPLETIIEVARGRTRLRGSRGRRVLALTNADDRTELARRGGWILTSLAQSIPYQWEAEDDFDWDHIFPRAQADQMWQPGAAGRKKHHPDRHLVNSTGNYWALKKSANRSLQDTRPRKKFELLHEWAQGDSTWRVWAHDRWSLTSEEIEGFIAADDLLDGTPNNIEEGMRVFRETTSTRSRRLLDLALARFPDLDLLAGGEDGGIEPTPPRSNFTEALGITTSDALLTTFNASDAAQAVKERREGLMSIIREELERSGLWKSGWSNQNVKKGRITGWVAFELISGNCVELMPRWVSGEGASLVVKAYPRKGKPDGRDLYPDFDHISLGVPWSSPDIQIVTDFLQHVKRVEESHPR